MYYNNNSSSVWLEIALWIGILFTVTILINACTATDWNDGKCPKCHERYELAGVSRYTKYYVCDSCGKEVERW